MTAISNISVKKINGKYRLLDANTGVVVKRDSTQCAIDRGGFETKKEAFEFVNTDSWIREKYHEYLSSLYLKTLRFSKKKKGRPTCQLPLKKCATNFD